MNWAYWMRCKTLTKSEYNNLYLYLIRKLDALEGELIDCQNRLRYRRADHVDVLEYQIALTRLQAFSEFSKDVNLILNLKDKE